MRRSDLGTRGTGGPQGTTGGALKAATFYRNFGKCWLDIALSSLMLLITAPLLLLGTVVVWLELGSPILFRQRRPGLHGRTFTILKFRTMRDSIDGSGESLPDSDRLGPVGRVMRSLSLDELPELLNVLVGDLSLVGPRPLLMEYLPLYSPEQARRHDVRPGLTGWAQVSGRNALGWEERFALDVWYVDHVSLGVDLRILGGTAATVLRREGIAHPGSATMERFRGNLG